MPAFVLDSDRISAMADWLAAQPEVALEGHRGPARG